MKSKEQAKSAGGAGLSPPSGREGGVPNGSKTAEAPLEGAREPAAGIPALPLHAPVTPARRRPRVTSRSGDGPPALTLACSVSANGEAALEPAGLSPAPTPPPSC